MAAATTLRPVLQNDDFGAVLLDLDIQDWLQVPQMNWEYQVL